MCVITAVIYDSKMNNNANHQTVYSPQYPAGDSHKDSNGIETALGRVLVLG